MPSIKQMKFTLLTSRKELLKKSNTGQLVLEVLGDMAEQICWDRMNPPISLVAEIAAGRAALVYPGSSDGVEVDFSGLERLILIDSTWHEARKIHQRSPYLLKAKRITLNPSGKSRYNLRKNQKESCLCTAECVMDLLRKNGEYVAAEELEKLFLSFIRPDSAIKPPLNR